MTIHDLMQDTLWNLHPCSDRLYRVPFNAYGHVPEVSPLEAVKEVRGVLVECPKQVQCRELLGDIATFMDQA